MGQVTFGKEKLLGVITVIILLFLFCFCFLFKGKPISELHNRAKKAGSKLIFLGAFASCFHNLDRCQ